MVNIMSKFYSLSNRRPDSGISFTNSKSRTKQEFKGECDINNIMDFWSRNGFSNHINSSSPQYSDVSNYTDYQSAVNTVLNAESLFNSLPARVRDRFQNSASHFLKFVSDPRNREEVSKLGLLNSTSSEPAQKPAPKAGASESSGVPDGGSTPPAA